MTISANTKNSDPSERTVPVEDGPIRRHELVEREHREFGGIRFGTGLLGWLTATGTTVILSSILAAGGWMGVSANLTTDAVTLGVIGGITVLVILFVAYFSGGYVAGRMSRFDGAKQGLAVWLWAIIVAGVLAALSAIAAGVSGSQFDPFSLNGFPGLPTVESELVIIGVVTAVLALAVSLGGALLGGITGIRFTHKVDRKVARDVERRDADRDVERVEAERG